MKIEHYLTLAIIILTVINVVLVYLNLKYSRKKDFQEKLFQLKLDAFVELNTACCKSINRLRINSTPFVQIYEFNDKNEWIQYCEKHMSKEFIQAVDIYELTQRFSLILPSEILNKCYEFSNNCISFITSSYHFDAELIIANQDILANNYFDLINVFREDLNVDIIDKSLSKRISSRI